MSWYLYALIYAAVLLWLADSSIRRSRSIRARRNLWPAEVAMWRPTGYEAAVEQTLPVWEYVNEYRMPTEGSVLTAYLKQTNVDHYLALRRVSPSEMPTDALCGVPCMYAVFNDRIKLYPTPDQSFSVSYMQLQADASPLHRDPTAGLEQLMRQVHGASARVQQSLEAQWRLATDSQRRAWGGVSGLVAARETESCHRSIALLRDWLTPEQLAQFNEFRNFYVTGSKSRKLYLINYAAGSYNVTDGVLDYCLVPDASSGARSPGDIMLAQKIALETNEERALKLANKRRRMTSIPNFGNNHEVHNEVCNAIDWHTRDALLRFSGCVSDMGHQF